MAKQTHAHLEGSHSEYFSKKWHPDQRKKAPGRERVEIKLMLKSESVLDELDIPRNLTLKQREKLFAEQVGAAHDHFAQIRQFARKYRLKVEDEHKDLGIITLSGTVQSVNKAFKIDLHHHAVKHERTNEIVHIMGHEGKASVPAEIHGLVEAIIGLNDTPGSHQVPLDRAVSIGVCATLGKTSAWFAEHYKFPKDYKGKGQHIGIISCGGGYDPKDFEYYFKKIGLDNPPKIVFKVVGGSENEPGVNPLADYELYTDCLVAACAAPEATITICSVENSIYGFAEGVQYFGKLKKKRPGSISYSWGASETNYSQSDVTTINRILQYAAQVNQMSIFCSSGDFGSTNSSGPHLTPKSKLDNKLTVQYPASSPWITSCGGTMFELTSRGTVKKEVVWNAVYMYDMLVRNATGGGFSVMNKRPGYQKSIIAAGGFPRKVKSQRGVPDIAAHACIAPDNICFWVYMQGQNWVTGGTSAVAPLWAALTARLNEALGEPIGFFNPLLYKMVSSRALKSIKEGNNCMPNAINQWEATDGWDPCTGLGVPNGAQMLKWLRKNLKDE